MTASAPTASPPSSPPGTPPYPFRPAALLSCLRFTPPHVFRLPYHSIVVLLANGSGEAPLQVQLKTIHGAIGLGQFSLANLHRKCGRSHSHLAATLRTPPLLTMPIHC